MKNIFGEPHKIRYIGDLMQPIGIDFFGLISRIFLTEKKYPIDLSYIAPSKNENFINTSLTPLQNHKDNFVTSDSFPTEL